MLENTECEDEIESLIPKREVRDSAHDLIASVPRHVNPHQMGTLWEHILNEATCSSTDVEHQSWRPPKDRAKRLLDELYAEVVVPASTAVLLRLTRVVSFLFSSMPHVHSKIG